MTWIRVIPFDEDETLKRPQRRNARCIRWSMRQPTHPHHAATDGIVASHSLIPDALFHAFATFGALMSPELPLTRRQHEMITTVVSATNRCQY